ncbi:MAG TPA: radical SAM protein [Nitrospirae bacterium]|nr:radical SAM protein [Nitrospirota bacterium]
MTAIGTLLKKTIPGQLVIQYTDICNARCPQCGMRVSEKFPRSKLSVDVVKQIIDSASQKGMQAISFTGGEPLLFFDEIIRMIKYAEDAGIKYIRTGTNGFLFADHDSPGYRDRIAGIAEKLAETGIYTFWISIDSSNPEVHESMRGLPGVIEGIEKALPIFHEHGIYPSANLGINRNIDGLFPERKMNAVEFYEYFREAFRNFFDFIIDMGFTISNACYPMSSDSDSVHNDAVYRATSEDDVVKFAAHQKPLLFKALFDTIPDYRSRIRIFSPRSSLFSLIRQYTAGDWNCYPCRGGKEFFFIDARSGETYPCGYRGEENLGKFWEMDLSDKNSSPACRKCDWECFRDPSELFGPFQDLTSSPLGFFKRMVTDRAYMKLWIQDIQYYRACDFFNGRTLPDLKKLSKWASA